MYKISLFLIFLSLSITSISQNNRLQIPNTTQITSPGGKELIKVVVPGSPPPEILMAKSASISTTAVMINDVPTLNWCYGCTATSAAMAAGYYDRNGYDNIYTGSTNGGIFPLTNLVWGYGECPLSASHNGIDGRTTRGHVDDYWIEYNNASTDPFITNGWTEHSPDCTADYMKTSQSTYGNSDGATTLYYRLDGSRFESTNYDDDGGYGFQLFMEAKGYTVLNRYNQYLLGQGSNPDLGYTFDDYKTEIDNNRPVLIHVTGHTMLGVGYDDATQTIYIHDTWDHDTHDMIWGGSYSGMTHYSITVLELQSVTTTVSATITNNNYTYDGTSKSVTVTTTPTVLAHTVTYLQMGSPVINPTNAGIYDVVVTITETGYTSEGPFYGTLTINKKSLSAVAANKSINYGDDEPVYTINYNGFISGESTTDLTTIPVAYITETWPADPGTYNIYVGGGADENYSFSYIYGTLTVDGLSVNSVSVSNDVHTYDGNNKEVTVTTDPPGISNTVTYKLSNVIVPTPTNAASYDVTITIDEPGYNPDQVSETLTIEQVALTATADDKIVDYNDPEPAYSITYTGFISGENATVLDAVPTADVSGTWPLVPGDYSIVITGGIDNNYSITSVNGNLTVSPLQADSVMFANLIQTYDGNAHEPTINTYPNNISYNISYFDLLSNPITNIIDAGIYTVEITITETGYIQDVFTDMLTVEKADLDITAKDTTITYGANQPAYTLLFTGFVNGESESILDELPASDIAETWPVLPGTYIILVNGGQDNNYNYSTTNGILTVNPAVVHSVEFSNLAKTYTGLPQYPTILVDPDTVNYSITYTNSNNQFITNPVNAGTYLITVVITETGYQQDIFNENLIIEKTELVVTAMNTTVTFDDPEPNYQIDYSGFVNEESTSDIAILPIANIQETWPVYPGTYAIRASSGDDENYSLSYVDGILTVEGLSVNNVIVSNNSYIYDGTNKAVSVTTSPADLSHTISYSLNEQQVTSPINAGTYDVTVTITEPGYNFDQFNSNMIINKASLITIANNQSVVYGETEPAYTINYIGFITSEDVSVLDLAPTAGVIGSWPLIPGNYPIVVSGGSDNNYTITNVNGCFTVVPAQIDSLKFADLFFTYDGITHEATVLIYPDTVDFATTYTNSDNQIDPLPTDAGIYLITTIVTESVYKKDTFYQNLTIEKASLTATVLDTTIDYGDSEPDYTILFEGFVTSENSSVIDILPTATVAGTRPLLPGTYTIELTGGSDNNYAISTNNGTLNVESNGVAIAITDTLVTYNGLAQEITINTIPLGIQCEVTYYNETQGIIPAPTLPGNYQAKVSVTEPGYDPLEKTTSFIIKKATLTVTVQNETINFGDPIPEFTYSLSGFVNGENESIINTLPTLQLDGTDPLLPGDYLINASDGEATNYNFNYQQGLLMVTPLNVQSIIVTDTISIYNGTPQLISVSTIPLGVNVIIQYYDENIQPVTSPLNAGHYVYRVIISETGYNEKEIRGKLEIKPALLTVGIEPIELTYGDNEPVPVITYTGFVNGESQTILSELPTVEQITNWPWNASTYSLTISEGSALNYTLVNIQGQLIVQPATLNVTPDDFTITYNDPLPEFTYKVTGFVLGENESVLTTLPIVQTQEENPTQPSTYQLLASGGSALNYTFIYNIGSLTIEPIGNAEIHFSDTVGIYNGLPHEVTVTTIPAGLSYILEYNQQPVNAGTYGAMATIDEPGYSPLIKTTSIQISKVILTATPHDLSILMGDEIPELTYDITGFVNSETNTVIDQLPIGTIEDPEPLTAGSHTILLSGGIDNNYDFTYESGEIEVIQTYMIKIYASDNGTVALGENGAKQDSIWERVTINENSSSFYAQSNNGYLFEKWDNGSTDNPIIFNSVNNDITITANFKLETGNNFQYNNILFEAYPNPVETSQLIQVVVELPEETYSSSKILVTDLLGRKIVEVEKPATLNQLKGLEQGVYNLILLIDGKKIKHARLLVK